LHAAGDLQLLVAILLNGAFEWIQPNHRDRRGAGCGVFGGRKSRHDNGRCSRRKANRARQHCASDSRGKAHNAFMTGSHGPLGARVADLVTLFNRQAQDLPDRSLHKDCVFRLNGRAYHEQLGRPSTDPLIRLIGCGPAGYRLLVGALRYATGAPELFVHADQPQEVMHADRERTLTVRATLTGRLRHTRQTFRAECGLTVTADASGSIREIAVTMGDPDVELLLAARRSA
jgi:hypothetical protein